MKLTLRNGALQLLLWLERVFFHKKVYFLVYEMDTEEDEIDRFKSPWKPAIVVVFVI